MRKRSVLCAVALVVLLLVSCAPLPRRSAQAGPDWSRGQLLGESTFSEPVAVYAEPDGSRVHLGWGRTGDAGDRIWYAQLDAQGRVLLAQGLALWVRLPHRISLMATRPGELVVLFLSGLGDERRLFAARINTQGEVLGRPVQVNATGVPDDYAAVSAGEGIEVFWSHDDAPAPGLYHVRLLEDGQPEGKSTLLVPGGSAPEARLATDGQIHLAWMRVLGGGEEQVYYTCWSPQTRSLSAPLKVGQVALGSKALRYGPAMALSATHVYVFWSWQRQAASILGGAGEGESAYVALPLEGVAPAPAAQHLVLPANPVPHYASVAGSLACGRLADLSGEPSALTYMPAGPPGQWQEAAVALVVETSARGRTEHQIAVVLMEGQAVKGYQIAGRPSTTVAKRPALSVDAAGQMHLAWLVPAGVRRYEVYYATTWPGARATMARVGSDDLQHAVYTGIWALAQALSMAPLGIAWLFVPFVFVMLYYVVKADGELDRRGPRIALGVAVGLYVLVKFFILPANYLGAAPGLDRLPSEFATAYAVALPVVVLLTALGAMAVYIRRRETPTLLMAFLVFGVADCGLTFLLYAPGVYG
ncbi:MAG: hypothetical protein ACUVX9_04090 [Anaerolineae bacterium]